jgi:Protein of unknown function (DUF3455)
MMQNRTLKYFFVAAFVAVISPALAQNKIDAPAGQQAMLSVKGDGVQIYVCKNVDGAAQWLFQAPEAKLLDSAGKEVGTHGAGPFWKSADGSLVKGQLLASEKAPGAGDIAWLLLRASAHEGTGVFSTVEYIRRTETHGGVAPSSGCDAEHLSSNTRVPYTATYTFYSAKP